MPTATPAAGSSSPVSLLESGPIEPTSSRPTQAHAYSISPAERQKMANQSSNTIFREETTNSGSFNPLTPLLCNLSNQYSLFNPFNLSNPFNLFSQDNMASKQTLKFLPFSQPLPTLPTE